MAGGKHIKSVEICVVVCEKETILSNMNKAVLEVIIYIYICRYIKYGIQQGRSITEGFVFGMAGDE